MPPIQPLVALRNARVTFGGAPLFADISFSIARGERACLVGANGAGKSTILRIIAGQLELDGGERFVQPGVRIGYLEQSPMWQPGASVAEVMASVSGLNVADYRIAALLDQFDLGANTPCDRLSGGESRRLALARALIGEPDLLLLDEPTNHLDLPTVLRLEEMVREFKGGVLLISHDRAFLTSVSTRVLWLDRGRLFGLDHGYGEFEQWSRDLMEREAEEQRRLKKKIEIEEYWLARGVTARRSRNQGRRRKLMALRQEKARSLKALGKARLQLSESEAGGRLAIEAIDIAKSFAGADGDIITVLRGFSTRIMRGDRIGVIGPNGAGKSTLVNILTGVIAPDSGSIRLGKDLSIIRLDQKREIFDLDRTLWQTLAPGGGDSIVANGRERHVVAYLRDFLFDERQTSLPVRTLSGGERARLILARLFASPGNLLVLDEPTNDLDLDTLDMLEDVLADFEGTLIMVSHDRDFLDRLATSTIALEGDGEAIEYAGGYSDYLAQRPARGQPRQTRPRKRAPAPSGAPTPASNRSEGAAGRLSFKERRELDELPAMIEAITGDVITLERALGDATLYARDPAKFEKAGTLLAEKRAALARAEDRWLELAARA
jgi:ATP-binding cassette subfamily F protein uup